MNYGAVPLRLPQSKTYCVGGGRRKFVFDCGVIGLCPPCTRATPLTGVFPCWWVGERREPCARAPDSKPTGILCPAGWWVYWRKASSTHPPANRATPLSGVLPLCTVGRYQLPRSHKQTSSSLLPPSTKFMTAVTAMP